MTEEDKEVARILAMTTDEVFEYYRVNSIDPLIALEQVHRAWASAKIKAYRRRMKIYV